MAEAVANALGVRHTVVVLCGRPSYDPEERHPFYLLWREKRGSIFVERVGSTTFSRHRMLHRLTNYLSYVFLAIPRALTIRADVVVAMTDPPFAGIVGAFVAWLKRRPFVYNIRDLYPEMVVASEIVRPGRWLQFWERLHRWALGRSARVIVLGEDTRQRIVGKGVDPGRVVVVRDGARMPQMVPNPDHRVIQDIRGGYRFVLMHAGNLGFYGAWDTIVKAAHQMNGDGLGFVFVGDGAMRKKIEQSANGCHAIRFLPFRPPDEVPLVLAAGDVHLITIRRGLEGVVVPSKLYPILAAGRPVLALAPEGSDVARVIRRSGCGIVVSPDDPAALAAAARQLARNPGAIASMSVRAAAIAPEFSMPRELARLVETVEGVV